MHIKIGGIKYKVSFVDDLRDETGKRVNGTLVIDMCTIDVATDVSEQKKHMIILHEVVHALNAYFDVDCGEHIVVKMGYGLYSFIVDNPELVKEIIKTNEKSKT